jgi:hypothetical protein
MLCIHSCPATPLHQPRELQRWSFVFDAYFDRWLDDAADFLRGFTSLTRLVLHFTNCTLVKGRYKRLLVGDWLKNNLRVQLFVSTHRQSARTCYRDTSDTRATGVQRAQHAREMCTG